MKRSIAVMVITFGSSVLLSGHALGQSDYYIRSHYTNGSFTGFHEILTAPKKGYHAALYCDRTFWVTSNTVLWTEQQTAAGNDLFLEENDGDNRRVICSDKDAFATLDDLGLKRLELKAIREKDSPQAAKPSRIRTIRDAFKQYK
ncbi:hypothetical protein [Roseibium aggregatum]|uniref:Uncharacterized protein n=1 Tax=Roseibium aggregatum TaxID=187304 RepID=A0A939EFL6_9HYPH|nr:hypothetical protein [Roseibium aggregatum]MBN9670659.1 hypothetical protein [Roseibium aggregatum]